MASGENTLVKTAENTYTGIINLTDVQSGTPVTLRCYVVWENDETKNEQDSQVGAVFGQEISLSARVTATQYLGETITEYVP
jgi:hypothetical protein